MTFAEITHRGGLTYGIRVEGDGVDLLLHDGQYLESERATARAYGHATVDDAIQFAQRCGARRLVLTHHAPGRTDDALSVELARQGDVLPVVG